MGRSHEFEHEPGGNACSNRYSSDETYKKNEHFSHSAAQNAQNNKRAAVKTMRVSACGSWCQRESIRERESEGKLRKFIKILERP